MVTQSPHVEWIHIHACAEFAVGPLSHAFPNPASHGTSSRPQHPSSGSFRQFPPCAWHRLNVVGSGWLSRSVYVCMQRSSRSAERLVIAWQIALAAVVVATGVSVLASMLRMPRTGYRCDLCNAVTCQSFLGWRCGAAANREGFCEIRVFPDSSAVLVCPSQDEIVIEAVTGDFAMLDVDAECDARCGGPLPPPPPDPGPPDGGDGAGVQPPAPGFFRPVVGLPEPVAPPSEDGTGDSGGTPGGGGAQFIDPTVGTDPGADDVGATAR